MDKKLNKYVVIIAAICTIIPLNVDLGIFELSFIYIPMILGYTLYYTQYNTYSKSQKKTFKIALIFGIVNFLSGLWTLITDNIDINSFNEIRFDMVLAPLLLDISYYGHRILSLILCIKLLKKNYTKFYISIMIIILIGIFIILPKIFNVSNYKKVKGDKLFGNNYCAGHYSKNEFNRDIPWTCKICGYSSDVINPDKNVPIICFSCSLYTGRCMECGSLEKNK